MTGTVILFILSIIIIALILIQQSDTGLYGQGTNINKTRRGSEKAIFNLTIIIGVLFVLVAIINFFLL